MKRSCSLGWLLDRSTPWLPWWQELLLNWIASWQSISVLAVVSLDGRYQAEWSPPSDLDLKRAELEELVQ